MTEDITPILSWFIFIHLLETINLQKYPNLFKSYKTALKKKFHYPKKQTTKYSSRSSKGEKNT